MKDDVTIAKGIGIIMMVMGHCGTPFASSYFYMFHMPLFFILSGYCLKGKYLNDNKAFIARRFKGLYIPFVKYGLLFLILHNLFFHINIYNDSFGWNGNVSQLYSIREILSRMIYGTLLFNSSEQLLGGYWFLTQLFFASIIGLFLIRYVKNVFLGCGIAIALCLIMKLIDFRIPYTSICDLTLFSTAFFVIGYAFQKHNIALKNIYHGLFCAIIVYIGVIFWHSEMTKCSSTQLLPYFTTAVLGSLMIMQFSNWLSGFCKLLFLRNFLFHAGKHTMGILTWHFLSFKIVTLIVIILETKPIEMLAQFPTLDGQQYRFLWIFYSIAGLGVPLLGIWLSNRISSSIKSLKWRTNTPF